MRMGTHFHLSIRPLIEISVYFRQLKVTLDVGKEVSMWRETDIFHALMSYAIE